MSTQDLIKEQVTKNKVVLYMKGTPDFPQCGFSANTIGILKECGVKEMFTINVLENPEIRQGIKQYANWPTIPQLYVNVNLSAARTSSPRCSKTASCKHC